jgi:tRNA G46 methylase TrmB
MRMFVRHFSVPHLTLVPHLHVRAAGYGVGDLVYARSDARAHNLLGVDLSGAGVGYARGIASRWGVHSRCAFVRHDARAVLRAAADTYPGGVQRVVLSCPTPYAQLAPATDEQTAPEQRAPDEARRDAPAAVQVAASGNGQLPASPEDECFLGHASVFDEIATSLAPGGTLHLASNVEDVALTMLHTAQSCGLEPVVEPADGAAPESAAAAAAVVPRRQQRWREAGGERADGEYWRAGVAMPWASETERTHALEGRPVHRVVLRKPA